MKIIRTKAKDIYIISHKKIKDSRGFFMRSFCKRIFKKKGINFNIKQLFKFFLSALFHCQCKYPWGRAQATG